MTERHLHSQVSSVWVLIPAAGIGRRMQSETPKQYLKINHRALIEYTLDCFLEHPKVAGVVVVLSPADEHWQTLNINTKLKPVLTTQGGVNRSDSVIQGLRFLDQVQNIPPETWVMVHDAARPCLSPIDIDALLAIGDTDCIGGLLASPVRDTMKRSITSEQFDGANTVLGTVSRENLWHALTPQMFRLGALESALEHCKSNGIEVTDECSAMEYMGERPIIVESINHNIKVTQPSDITLLVALLREESASTAKTTTPHYISHTTHTNNNG